MSVPVSRRETPSQPFEPQTSTTSWNELEKIISELETRYLGLNGPPSGVATSSGRSVYTSVSRLENKIQSLVSNPPEGQSQKPSFSHAAKLPVMKRPELDGQSLDDFIDDLGRWLRLSGVSKEPDEVKLDWLLEMATRKVKTLLKKLMVHNASFSDVLLGLSKLFPKI